MPNCRQALMIFLMISSAIVMVLPLAKADQPTISVSINNPLPPWHDDYFSSSSTVNYYGYLSDAQLNVPVGIEVKDRLGTTLFTDQVMSGLPGGQFAGSFALNLAHTEGAAYIHANANGYTNGSKTFFIDLTKPTAAVTSPVNNTVIWDSLGMIEGTSSDPNLADGNPGAGIQQVLVALQRASDWKYWNGGDWGSETWLSPFMGEGGAWQLFPSGYTMSNGLYKITPKAIDMVLNSAASAPTFFTFSNALATVVTALPAYHGAHLSWTAVGGMTAYNVAYEAIGAPWQSYGDYSGSTLALNVTDLDSRDFWPMIDGQNVTWHVTPSQDGMPYPGYAGVGYAVCLDYKILDAGTQTVLATRSEIKVRLNYSSGLFGLINAGTQIGEVVTMVEGVPHPVAIMIASPINLVHYGSTGYYIIDYTPEGGIAPGTYQVWFFLWNRLPSEGGSWEAYLTKVTVEVTIT